MGAAAKVTPSEYLLTEVYFSARLSEGWEEQIEEITDEDEE